MNPRLQRVSLRAILVAFAFVLPLRGLKAQPATSGPEARPESVASDKLRPGDHIRLQILEDEEAPLELVIAKDGSIDVPYLGVRSTTGLSALEFATEVKAGLEADFYVHATVRVFLVERPQTSTNRGRIFVTGQVRRVGMVEIDKSERNTVSKVILANGGLSDFAESKSVKIFRSKPDGTIETRIVDLQAVLEKGRIDKDEPIMDGDLIVVDSKIVNW